MKDAFILYPRKTYILIGSSLVPMNPVVLRKQYDIFAEIVDFTVNSNRVSYNVAQRAIISLDSILKLLTNICEIMYPNMDISNITLPQASYILFSVWRKLFKLMSDTEERAKNDANYAKDVNIENAFSKAVDLICSEYGWPLEYIYDNLTTEQFILILDRIGERKEIDMKFIAACHGADVSGQPTAEDKKALKDSIGKQSKVDPSDVYNIQPGNLKAIKNLLTWLGVPIPPQMDVSKNEDGLRILAKARISDLRKVNKLPKIDILLDPIEVCYKIGADDIIGIKKKLEELDMYPDSDIKNIEKDLNRYKAALMAKYISNIE